MDLAKQLESLSLSTCSDEQCFEDYFRKGSAGRTVCMDHVVPFLTLDDLVSASSCCRQMNAMCRSYTVGEVLSLHSMDHISRAHKMELGKLVMGFASRKWNKKRQSLHRRYVRKGTERFWARLYHPSVVPDILLAMTAYFHRHSIEFDAGMDDYDWDANADPKTPILVKATFGDRLHRTTDVTVILRYLLMKKDNKRLILKPPLASPRYWYIYLFGDPCPRVTKMLRIRWRYENSNETKEIVFHEDTPVAMKLRAVRPDEAE